MGLTDRLAYLVTVDPRNAVAGFGQVGQAASAATKKADAEIARLQKRIDSYERQASKAGRKNDPLGADVARIKAAGLGKELQSLQAPAKGARASLESVGLGGDAAAAGAALASVAVAKFGVDAAFSADRLATAQRATDTIFKESAKSVLDFSESADQSLGVSKSAALTSLNAFGTAFSQAGLAGDDAAKFAQGFTATAAILARAHPEAGNTEDALNALRAALRGEFDPLERFGVQLKAADVEQQGLALGLAKTSAGLTKQHKVLATAQLLYNASTIAAKDYAESNKTLAANQDKASAAIQDFKDSVGGVLAEDVGAVVQAVARLAGVAEQLAGAPEGKFLKTLLRIAESGAGPLGYVADLAGGFNDLFPAADKSADALANFNNLNLIGKTVTSTAAASVKDLAKAQKEITDASKARLSATQGLLDADDKVIAAKKAVADASDDEAQKAEKVADARQAEVDAAKNVASAEEALNKARREAPRNLELAGIAARDAGRAEADALKERDKVARRRGPNDPKTLEAQDKLAAATIATARAQDDLNDLQGKGGVPKSVQDAIDTRDGALRAATDAEKRTREALAVNPYEAQQEAAKQLRDAENDRLRAVTALNGELDKVTGNLLAGFDAASATRVQIEAQVAALTQAQALRPSIAADLGALPPLARGAAVKDQILPDLGGLPNRGSAAAFAGASTTVRAQFNGPITVQASDPAAMQRQLEAEQRRRRLNP